MVSLLINITVFYSSLLFIKYPTHSPATKNMIVYKPALINKFISLIGIKNSKYNAIIKYISKTSKSMSPNFILHFLVNDVFTIPKKAISINLVLKTALKNSLLFLLLSNKPLIIIVIIIFIKAMFFFI